MCEKVYILNPETYSYGNGEYVESITDDTVIKSNRFLGTVKTTSTKTALTWNVPKKVLQ